MTKIRNWQHVVDVTANHGCRTVDSLLLSKPAQTDSFFAYNGIVKQLH